MDNVAYPHIATRLFGNAHAIEPNPFLTLVEGPLAKRILSATSLETPQAASLPRPLETLATRLAARTVVVGDGIGEYAVTPDGIAIVPVYGLLARRFDWLTALCGWTTYEGLQATFDAMLADDRVAAVLMDVESPGGEVGGLIDAADAILAARRVKPVWAVANDFAASAAYAIAGSAERLVLPRLGQVGSIGAMMVHVDESAADAASGLRYTAIHAGARKMDGWEHSRLKPDARAALQGRVDHCRDELAALIDRQGRISMEQALATEAAMYSDRYAIEEGLADGIMTFDEALAELSGRPQARRAPTEGTDAIDRTNSPAAEGSWNDVIARVNKQLGYS